MAWKIAFAWQIAKGIKNGSDDELEASAEACEVWGWYCGALVILGLIGEVLLAVLHPPRDSIFDRWGSVAADMLVAVGVAGEVQFARMGFRREQELTLRSNEKLAIATESAAQANARATEAQQRIADAEKETAFARLEQERLKGLLAWRSIGHDAGLAIGKTLSEGKPGDVNIQWPASDIEAQYLSLQLLNILQGAGWNTHQLAISLTSAVTFGIAVSGSASPEIEMIRRALTSGGIEYSDNDPPRPLGGTQAFGAIPHDCTTIYVGSKPASSIVAKIKGTSP